MYLPNQYLTPGLTSVSADSISTAMGSRWYILTDYPIASGAVRVNRTTIQHQLEYKLSTSLGSSLSGPTMSHTLSQSVVLTQVRMFKMTRASARRELRSITLSKISFTSFLTYPSGPRRLLCSPPLDSSASGPHQMRTTDPDRMRHHGSPSLLSLSTFHVFQ